MEELACINGRIQPLSRAFIHIEDRGFQLGDGIYEVIVSYQGRLLELDAHLERMERSAQGIRLQNPYSQGDMKTFCERIFAQSGIQDALLYVQLTRGVSPRQHPIPSYYEPNLIITVKEKPPPLEECTAITREDLRWKLCAVKSTNLLPNVLAKTAALEAGSFEPILIREGLVTEGATTNLFLVKGESVYTPPADGLILEGITRKLAIEIMQDLEIEVQERRVWAQELFTADEIFFTGSISEVTAVLKVDGKNIGDGKRGPYSKIILEEYRKRAFS